MKPINRYGQELYVTGTGQEIWVHRKGLCKSSVACVIHHPSNHAMRDFPTHWRSDQHMMERICPHGVGHPDPDDIAHSHRDILHGCDSCCSGRRAFDLDHRECGSLPSVG